VFLFYFSKNKRRLPAPHLAALKNIADVNVKCLKMQEKSLKLEEEQAAENAKTKQAFRDYMLKARDVLDAESSLKRQKLSNQVENQELEKEERRLRIALMKSQLGAVDPVALADLEQLNFSEVKPIAVAEPLVESYELFLEEEDPLVLATACTDESEATDSNASASTVQDSYEENQIMLPVIKLSRATKSTQPRLARSTLPPLKPGTSAMSQLFSNK